MRDRLSAFDLAEGFQLAHAVAALENESLFGSLSRPVTASALAKEHGLDARILAGTLEFVAARTDLIRKRGARFVATSEHGPQSSFLIRHYVGAYGKNASRLAELFRRPKTAPKLIDRRHYANAFEALEGRVGAVLPQMIRQLGLNHVLDLGCGPASLLVRLASDDAAFFGWGIEENPAMCAAARRRVREANLVKRVQVLRGDAFDPLSVLERKVATRVQGLVASNLANELFAESAAPMVAWLRRLRRSFDGRPLLIADYYGRLGRQKGKLPPRAGLHDFVQLISGQGIPPSDLAGWRKIYTQAGCVLLHVVEARDTTYFFHVLKL